MLKFSAAKCMEYLEVIIKNVNINRIKYILEELKFEEGNIKTSHFYDKKQKRDMEYKDVKDISAYFEEENSCLLFMKQIDLGIEIEETILTICSDKSKGDITIQFPDETIEKYINSTVCMKEFVYKLMYISECKGVDEVIFGYEPAEDLDMMVMVMKGGAIEINKERMDDNIAKVICNVTVQRG